MLEYNLTPGKVCFEIRRKYERAGKEIKVNKRFEWDNRNFIIPSVYVCKSGLVIDVILEADSDKVKAYIDNPCSENPLNDDFALTAFINGEKSGSQSCSYGYWISFYDECKSEITKANLEYYGLDLSSCCCLCRVNIPYDNNIKAVSVTFEKEMTEINGAELINPREGDRIELSHPISKKIYTLTVLKTETAELNFDMLSHIGQDFPKHYIEMEYSLSPDLEDNSFYLCDTVNSEAISRSASSVAVISGADGPTAVYGIGKGKRHTAVSSFHLEPVDTVKWRTVFREKLCDDISVDIL